MLGLAARYAQSWNTDWVGPLDEFSKRKASLDQACLQIGRNPKTIEINSLVAGIMLGS